MKFGIQYLYWRKDLGCQSYLPYVEKAQKVGFDILELGDYLMLEMSGQMTGELAAAAKHHNIQLTAGLDPQPGCCLTDDNNRIRQNGIDFFTGAFRRLHALGITTMGGNLLNAPPRTPFLQCQQTEWERGVQSVSCLGKRAQQYGITICLEVVNRFEGHLLNTAKIGRQFADEVGLANVKLLLDGFHMNIEESGMADGILDAGDRLGHFHFIENHRGLPGTGHIPWAEVRGAMQTVGYDGAMVMEALVRAGGTLGDCVRIWRDMTGNAAQGQLNEQAAQALQYARCLFGQGR